MIKYKFLFFAIFPLLLNAEAITSLNIQGNQNVENKLITEQLFCTVGKDCTEEQISQSIKRLHATDLFQKVTMRIQEGVLEISVKENPIIHSIILDGNKSLGTKELNKVMALKANSLLADHKLQQDIMHMLNLYQNQGTFEVAIHPYKVELDNNKIDIVYKIQEGNKAKIQQINFENNKSFSDHVLQRIILSKQYQFYNFLSESHYYVKERLDIDASLLRNFYFSRGFLNFKIVSMVPEFDEDGVDITFNIEEGKKYHVNNVDIVSNIKTLEVEPVKQIMQDITGHSFNINEINKAISEITLYLNDQGYYFIEVEPQYKTNDNSVDITYHIKESKKVYIDTITVNGNDHTLEHVIRHEMKISEGDPYNLTLLQRSKQNISKLGFFDMVYFTTKPTSAKDKVDVDFSVQERNTGFMNIGGAYSSNAGIVGNFSVNESNLLGTGNKLSFSLEKSSPTLNASLSFTRPYIFNSPISSGFDIFKQYSEHKHGSSYKNTTYGLTLRTSYNITDNIHHLLSYSYKRDNTYDVSDKASQLIKEQAGITHTSMIGHNISYSKLDNPIRPKNGYFLKLKQDLAGIGGDLYYLRSTASATHFMTDHDITIQASMKGGYITAYNNQTVGMGQRFFAGSNEIRGFKPSGIGPRDKTTKDALGGKFRAIGSLQADFPIGFPEDIEIKGSVFLDSAILTSLDNISTNIADSGNIRASVGFGVSWFSPLGILRLDFGFPFLKDEDDQTEMMRFNIGSQF